MAGFVLANGSMSSNQSGEGEVRKSLIENDLVDCMVALPGQLFYSTQIPVCLWFLARDRKNHKFRDRRGNTLFIDARKMGKMVDRAHAELTVEDIQKVAATYHAWRGDKGAGKYEDVRGFCKSVSRQEIIGHGYALTPGRYVGAEELIDDDAPFEERFGTLRKNLMMHFKQGNELRVAIEKALSEILMQTETRTLHMPSGFALSRSDWAGVERSLRRRI